MTAKDLICAFCDSKRSVASPECSGPAPAPVLPSVASTTTAASSVAVPSLVIIAGGCVAFRFIWNYMYHRPVSPVLDESRDSLKLAFKLIQGNLPRSQLSLETLCAMNDYLSILKLVSKPAPVSQWLGKVCS